MLNDDGRGLAGGHPSFESAWERYLIAEQRALVARAEGILGRSLIEASPGESQEELDRVAEEDRRLAREGLVELMDEEGETYHKHIDELEPWDVADRVRAQTARAAWLASRTQQRIERQKARRLSGLNGATRRTPRLSHRQLEILKGAARGLPNRLIAKSVHLSEGTVKRHLANIYAEIGVRSRGEAVAKGVTEGWLVLEDIAPGNGASNGAHTAAEGRYRCVVDGCGREVVVVRDSRDTAHPGPPSCHGHKMGPVGIRVPANEGAREGS
jgi:DNA-binding CsgD family transcriptional regulator